MDFSTGKGSGTPVIRRYAGVACYRPLFSTKSSGGISVTQIIRITGNAVRTNRRYTYAQRRQDRE
ncbi:MAG: hypothetical protein LBH80_06590 [Prevotellaceae bacterium]|nr:hypothetical protein [Prevotellaceae bacterium]